ncbi:peptidoglycan DD-metalloendopeptidase family protein [Mycetocola reblochoni]|uniref:Secreted peptidase n=2 Tax=Mycetocola reblochoni TaxID=331618 RepID=A0A1R4ISZ4_9MICO|nr:peptidoglycan DD-metalloendopeptidase family protein [Mycetocola reblochoni]SJN22838.1 secreted peptidase [Mycetocola reblochoni REB411]
MSEPSSPLDQHAAARTGRDAAREADAQTPPPSAPGRRVTAALRVPALKAGAWLVLVSVVLLVVPGWGPVLAVPAGVGAALLLIAVVASSASPTVSGAAPVLQAPVRGGWAVLASPSPSSTTSRTADLGAAFALVLAGDPEPRRRPRPLFGNPESGLLAPERFPGFGEPVLSMADGVVVRVVDGRRDHRSRSRWAARIWQYSGEALLRLLGPVSSTLGNHVVVRLDDGSHLLYGHLRRGSIQVTPGSRLGAGAVVAGCGASGACAEPQLLVQRQDRATPLTATGLPWAIAGAAADGADGLPTAGERWVVADGR